MVKGGLVHQNPFEGKQLYRNILFKFEVFVKLHYSLSKIKFFNKNNKKK